MIITVRTTAPSSSASAQIRYDLFVALASFLTFHKLSF